MLRSMLHCNIASFALGEGPVKGKMWNFASVTKVAKIHRVMTWKLVALMLATTIPVPAAQPKCKSNPHVIAACYTVHGRLKLGADTVRLWLWPVGTKRFLGVTGGPVLDDAIAPIYPANIRFDSNTEAIFGDFEVCPFTPER